jgi:hypothetical protein
LPQVRFGQKTFLEIFDMYLFILGLLVNIWPSSLRTAAIKINSGQQACGTRHGGLFDRLPEYPAPVHSPPVPAILHWAASVLTSLILGRQN